MVEGNIGRLDLNTNVLEIGGIPHIGIADSWIIPDSGKVTIDADAKMRTLHNATILGDSIFAYHTIYNATLDMGKKFPQREWLLQIHLPKKGTGNSAGKYYRHQKVDSLEGYADYHIKALGYVNDSMPIELEENCCSKDPSPRP